VFPRGSEAIKWCEACRALLRPSRESKWRHLWICALSVISKRAENTGLIFHGKNYSKTLIPSHVLSVSREEFLPGAGKIFTMAPRHKAPA